MNDPHRPQFHFMPPANWMNDPNGLIWWQGRCHMFYQYNPHGPFWGTIHWGHAVSADMVRWEHLPIALAPTPDSADAAGCFSGCAVVSAGRPTIVYTGVRDAHHETQLPCVAVSQDDELRVWRKHPANPVISAPPAGLNVVGFRDHAVWREDGRWSMLIGSGIRAVGGAVLRYDSDDLQSWDYVGPLWQGNVAHNGEMWECPDFFPLDGWQVLIVSPLPLAQVRYFTGVYTNRVFTPQVESVVDWGESMWAPQTVLDPRGRRVLFGWLRERRDEATCRAAGWAGVMSLPRVLSVSPTGCLLSAPLPELATLRGRHWPGGRFTLAAGESRPLAALTTAACEIVAGLEMTGPGACGLRLLHGAEGEFTLIRYDPATGVLYLDCRAASLTMPGEVVTTAPVECMEGRLRLHVFFDRSVLEVFANGIPLTGRIYPTHNEGLRVEVFAGDRPLRVDADIWEMVSAGA